MVQLLVVLSATTTIVFAWVIVFHPIRVRHTKQDDSDLRPSRADWNSNIIVLGVYKSTRVLIGCIILLGNVPSPFKKT